VWSQPVATDRSRRRRAAGYVLDRGVHCAQVRVCARASAGAHRAALYGRTVREAHDADDAHAEVGRDEREVGELGGYEDGVAGEERRQVRLRACQRGAGRAGAGRTGERAWLRRSCACASVSPSSADMAPKNVAESTLRGARVSTARGSGVRRDVQGANANWSSAI
jgi:hypothetical protein